MLKTRVITSLCGIPILVCAIWFDKPLPWFTVLIAVWGVMAAYEFFRLVSASKVPPYIYFGIFLTLLFIVFRDADLLAAIEPGFNTSYIPPILFAALVQTLLWFLVYPNRQTGRTFMSGVWTIVGVLYAGWLLSNLVALRGLDDGRNWVFFAMFVTFAYDTAAYFTGRSIGRHKLAPSISPGKTWEGTVGGLAGAVLFSLLFTLSTPFVLPIKWGEAMLLGLLVSVFGQVGDLLESLFKRYVGVKDSGTLIRGHGGLLDRMDSIVFAGAVVYYYVIWVIQ